MHLESLFAYIWELIAVSLSHRLLWHFREFTGYNPQRGHQSDVMKHFYAKQTRRKAHMDDHLIKLSNMSTNHYTHIDTREREASTTPSNEKSKSH